MNRYYYTDKFKTDGKTLGPVSIEELEQLYIKQEITEKCLVCGVGASNWEPFLNVLATHNKTKRIQKSTQLLKGVSIFKVNLWYLRKGQKCVLKVLTGTLESTTTTTTTTTDADQCFLEHIRVIFKLHVPTKMMDLMRM